MLARRLLMAGGGGSFVIPNPLAFATLTRYSGNPILPLGPSGSWDDTEVDGESIFWDSRLGKWVMMYGAYHGSVQYNIGLAYSTDLVTWTKEAANPVFLANTPEASVIAPSVVQVSSSSYVMYYQTYGGTDGAQIYAATSSDLLTWTRANGGAPVIPVGSAGQWDDTFTFSPDAHLVGGTYYVYYGGQDANANRHFGYATSSDGVTFTKQGAVFAPQSGETNADLDGPVILGAGFPTTFDLFYNASLTTGDRFICYASTTNGGSTWTHHHDILAGSGSGWDSFQVFDAGPVVNNGALYLFYCGSPVSGMSTGLSGQIGLATVAWP